MSLLSKLKRLKKSISSPYAVYMRAVKQPIYPEQVLLEGGQGKNINGNMFALARSLATYPSFESFRCAFVVTKETEESALKRFEEYGIETIELVIRGSARYQELLARSRYLFTDNSFPPYLNKRDNQVYVNTWHGTPLKHLGHGDLPNSIASLANVQKNMLSADYVIFPNELTKSVFWDDYQLKTIFTNRYLMCDYPRNDSLVNQEWAKLVRERYSLQNKRVIAYMPTWRGAKRSADVAEQKKQIQGFLEDIDCRLGSNDVLFVNLHFLVTGGMDYSAYSHIRPFPSELETYDFLAACDILVTDYSSVFFDFASTGKKIVLFAYDKRDYLESKGTYIAYETLPFPLAETVDDLIPLITSDDYSAYKEFQKKYCPFSTGRASTDLLNLVLKNDYSALTPIDNLDAREHTLLFTSNSRRIAFDDIIINELPAYLSASNPLFICGGKSNLQTVSLLNQVVSEMPYLALVTSRVQTPSEKISLALASRSRFCQKVLSHKLKMLSLREISRILPGVKISQFVDLNANASYVMKLFAFSSYSRKAVLRDGTLTRVTREKQTEKLLPCFNLIKSDISHDRNSVSELGRANYFNAGISATLRTRHYRVTPGSYSISGLMDLRLARNMHIDSLSLRLETGEVVGKIVPLSFNPFKHLVRYEVDIPRRNLAKLPIHSWVNLIYVGDDCLNGAKRIRYCEQDGARSRSRVGKIIIDKASNTTSYFRQGARNTLCFTTRDTISIDALRERMKLHFAHALTRLIPIGRNAIVLFEKNSSRFEESASIVYEKLIDEGYDNAYFILNKDSNDWQKIRPRYFHNIVAKNSFRHYILFFAARTFIGTEMLAHAIDVRPASRLVSRRLGEKNLNYIFLQHGVMYMLSLNSSSRTFFKPKKLNGVYRVVTSSELEKSHFVELGGYDPSNIYVCGLPKFDRNTWNEDADLIAIMPTWRPWEYNLARTAFEQTGYYKFIQTVISSIPEHLRSHVLVLPHPLFAQAIHHEEFPLKSYFDKGSESYDSILQRTKLLITDYSSIAYDAFYRGANVIFYWRDMEECLEHYGNNSKIMIDVSTAFGDVCFDQSGIPKKLVEDNFSRGQLDKYVDRYRRIVSFHDGHNTDRLMWFLREDHVI